MTGQRRKSRSPRRPLRGSPAGERAGDRGQRPVPPAAASLVRERRGAPRRPGPPVCRHLRRPAGEGRGGSRRFSAGRSGGAARLERRAAEPQSDRSGRRPAPGTGTGAALAPRRPLPAGCRPLPVRSLAAPRTFSEGPPSAGRSLSSSLQTNIGSLFQYMALPYRIPAPLRAAGARRGCSGDPAPGLCSQRLQEKSFVFKWVDPAARGPASLASPPAQNPPSEHGGIVISASEPAPGFALGVGGNDPTTTTTTQQRKKPKAPPAFVFIVCHSFPPPPQSKQRFELHLGISKEDKHDGKREYV